MSDASLAMSRSPPASVCLLAEHLDTALAAGEDLMCVRYVWAGAPPRLPAEIEALRSGQRAAIERMRTLELTLISRLLIARERAATVAEEDARFGTVGRLFVAGTAILIDAVAECGDMSAEDFDTGDDLTAYVRGRGLIAEDAPALVDTAPIGADDRFLVARRIPLGVLLDLAAAFLDTLDAEFDLFLEVPYDGEHASAPAAVPMP
jgi:hypothetical protein